MRQKRVAALLHLSKGNGIVAEITSMRDKIIQFPVKPSRLPLATSDVEVIGFLTKDDRDVYIKKREDIVKLMAFIKQNKITLYENDD